MSDGSIITSGNWHYQGVDCPFQNATVTMTDKIFTFNATGTAINPNVPSPYNVSTFTLNVTASAHNGISYATWSIVFSTQGWPSSLQGVSYATRKSGSGVTAGLITPYVSGVKVSVQNGQLQISGATVGETITVYSLQGDTLYSQKADAATVTINLPVHGAYMVKVGTESVKVVY